MAKRFVDVTNDVAFRKIFGNENKTEIIISFLNAVLKFEGDKRIREVSIVNPYQLPRIAGEKASIVDVRAVDMRGRQFIVEMQVASKEGFGKRVQYYTCRDYSMQIERGDQYPQLKPTHFIGILDFNFFEGKHYLSHHIIAEKDTREHKLTDIQFNFIELKKFNKKIDELETLVEKWIFFIKNAEDEDEIPNNVDDEGLREAYKDANKHSWTKEELKNYDNAFMAEQDARGRVTVAEKEAKNEEKEEGVERGWREGLSREIISKIVGLTIEDVKKIIEQLEQENK